MGVTMREASVLYRSFDGWLFEVDAATVEPGGVLVTASHDGGEGHPPGCVRLELPGPVLRLALALMAEAHGG